KSYPVNGGWDEGECLKLIKETIKNLDDKQDIVSELASLINFDQVNLEQLREETILLCSSTQSLPFNLLCFDILYIYEFVKSIGISPSNVVVGHKEKIETVTGAMVYNSRYIPPRKCVRLIGTLTLLHILFTIILFTSLAFYMMQKKKAIKHQKLPSYN
ncbi:hypothetical protein MXB_4837, partial [Myxobolus squamalis]